MKPNPTRSALLVIDMENGFVEPEGGHCIRFAKSTVPACVRAVETAREKGIVVMTTELPMYPSCGKLYAGGLTGTYE